MAPPASMNVNTWCSPTIGDGGENPGLGQLQRMVRPALLGPTAMLIHPADGKVVPHSSEDHDSAHEEMPIHEPVGGAPNRDGDAQPKERPGRTRAAPRVGSPQRPSRTIAGHVLRSTPIDHPSRPNAKAKLPGDRLVRCSTWLGVACVINPSYCG